jgi:hypothetical protein
MAMDDIVSIRVRTRERRPRHDGSAAEEIDAPTVTCSNDGRAQPSR